LGDLGIGDAHADERLAHAVHHRIRPTHYAHEIILNAACFICGTTELDPIALSPKKPQPLISADQLSRKKPT
jgi:hypothetical protein